jgi:hypothetical protein
MDIAAKIDDFGKPAWIVITILGFMVCWPVGLAILAFLLWSGRMACWKRGGWGRWENAGGQQRNQWGAGRWCGPGGFSRSSGNRAFDEYRAETLRRLEDEQREFMDFLDRLRQAKDKAEFDQFMAERGRQPQGPESQGPGTPGPAPQP